MQRMMRVVENTSCAPAAILKLRLCPQGSFVGYYLSSAKERRVVSVSPILKRKLEIPYIHICMKAIIVSKLARQHPIDYVPSVERLECALGARLPW